MITKATVNYQDQCLELRLNRFCLLKDLRLLHCVKSVRIRSYSGPYFPSFGQYLSVFSLNAREYEREYLRIGNWKELRIELVTEKSFSLKMLPYLVLYCFMPVDVASIQSFVTLYNELCFLALNFISSHYRFLFTTHSIL